MFEYSWILLALPAAGLLINLLFGQYFSRTIIGGIATGAVGLAFLVGVALFFGLTQLPPEEQIVTIQLWDWINIGAFEVDAALLITPLTVIMVLLPWPSISIPHRHRWDPVIAPWV